jgi:hypothetical protein
MAILLYATSDFVLACTRIDDKVHDNLLQLSAVDHHLRQIGRQIERTLLPDAKEYAITAVRPGGYAECNWLRGDLNLRN